jgi:hypothetical protein
MNIQDDQQGGRKMKTRFTRTSYMIDIIDSYNRCFLIV